MRRPKLSTSQCLHESCLVGITEESTSHMTSLVEAGIRSVFSSFPLLGVSFLFLPSHSVLGFTLLCKHCTVKQHPRLWGSPFSNCVVYSYSEFRGLPRTPNSFLLARNRRREMVFKSSNINHSRILSQPLIICMWIIWAGCATPSWVLL